jgi:hypothetical protein
MVTSINTAPVLRMRGGRVSVPRPCIPTCRCARADGTDLRFVCASAVPSPHSLGLTRTSRSEFRYNMYTHPGVYANRRARVSPRRTCATYAPRRACARALVCVRQRVRALHAAAERRVLGAQAFSFASAFNANIGAWNTARVTTLDSVCATAGPARTAAECVWSVADACAAVVRGGAADARARMQLCV